MRFAEYPSRTGRVQPDTAGEDEWQVPEGSCKQGGTADLWFVPVQAAQEHQ